VTSMASALKSRSAPAGPSNEADSSNVVQRVILIDGDCVLCNGYAKFVCKRDKDSLFHFETLQSPTGEQIMRDFGLPVSKDSVVLAEYPGEAYTRSTAVFRTLKHLPMPWPAVQIFYVIPQPIRDWLYSRFASLRYILFGRTEKCSLPDLAMRRKLTRPFSVAEKRDS